MYWIIGICAVVIFNVLVFMFMYGAGKQNKAYDKAMEELNKDSEIEKENPRFRGADSGGLTQ